MCPLCGVELPIIFHSARRQKIRFEENKILFIFGLYSISNRLEHRAAYSFDLNSNGWCAEFYNKEADIRLEKIHPLPRERFKKLDTNTGDYIFFAQCNSSGCCKYVRTSNKFSLDFKNASTGPLTVDSEQFLLELPAVNGVFKSHRLSNFYNEGSSYLESESWKDQDVKYRGIDSLVSKCEILKLPIIPFVSKEETISRINKLLIFS